MSTLLRIGELANRAGVSTRTVDFYTGLGLLHEADRTAGNFRLYDPSCVERIAAIRALEAQGVSLSDIAVALHGSAEDLTGQLSSLQRDVETLRELAASAPPEAHALLTAIVGRVQSLVAAAIELSGLL